MLSKQRKTLDLKKNFKDKNDNPVSLLRWKDNQKNQPQKKRVDEPEEQNKQSHLRFPWGLLQINQIMLLKYF